MSRLQTLAIAVALILGAASESRAVPITQPTGLNPGDQYRLVFATSTTRDATSSNIADYNAFVTGVADSVPELLLLGTTWTAIASTASVDARDNTSTNPALYVGVLVYNVADTLIATDYVDLWDLSIANPISVDEFGFPVGSPSTIWTGTAADGTADPTHPLGDPFATGFVQIGRPTSLGLQWITQALRAPTNEYHLYAISGVIVAVPEPGTGVLLAMGLALLAGVRRHNG